MVGKVCGFDLHFLMTSDVENLHMFIGHFYIFLMKCPFKSFDPPHFFFFFFFLQLHMRNYRSSQARGQIGARAAGLHHSHSNARTELRLWPSLQLAATRDP